MVLEDKACFVFQDSTIHLLMKVPMAKNKIFPFTLNSDMHAFEASLLESPSKRQPTDTIKFST